MPMEYEIPAPKIRASSAGENGCKHPKTARGRDVGVEGHNGKRSSDKRKDADQNRFAPADPGVFLTRILVR